MEKDRPCEICGQATSFERWEKDQPFEGELVDCCDRWVCPDCVCWINSDESAMICKDCCISCKEDKEYESISASSSSVSYSKQYLTGDDFFENDYPPGDLRNVFGENWKIYRNVLFAICLVAIFLILWILKMS